MNLGLYAPTTGLFQHGTTVQRNTKVSLHFTMFSNRESHYAYSQNKSEEFFKNKSYGVLSWNYRVKNLWMGSETTLNDIKVDTCYIFAQIHECTTLRVNSSVNYGLWLIIMCQCIININKCTTKKRNIDNGGGYACVRARNLWEISVPFCQFCYEVKTPLKNKHRGSASYKHLNKSCLIWFPIPVI